MTKQPDQRRSFTVVVPMTGTERRLVEEEAARAGLAMSEVVRLRLFTPTPPIFRSHNYPSLRLPSSSEKVASR